ncbi:WPP domain-interacting protein 2 isoform X2 [Ziziphus jujuba]|uniref:WPP domain-interacting protein 2 isoform X2 n=2 Tax=Ziziphus jujuba TaxID=326968 RepID=A0A6P3ZLR3_ZIZJJ|nr:WPP domain-interacting protein 2 isoform X2 [Ziziphus jujuba]KAH7545478.1 hypothetical protein FEM48_Zijuj01G0098200 [Ziziphus jujuba var. spinosa]
MDLESECSALESVEDNQVDQGVSHGDDGDDHKEIRNNGYCTENLADTREKDGGIENRLNSPVPESKSPSTKGYGLKKWRRIRREFNKDASASVVDTSKILKRGLSAPGNSIKPQRLPLETKHNSGGSVGSANLLNNVGALDGFAMHTSGSDSRFAVGSIFAAGTESENSEDRSSKSSTAASAPKARYDLPAVVGHVKNRMKNVSGKNFVNSTQRVQEGKGKAESSKKHRGERVKIEKENSHSSVESDSRSSNFFFMQGATLASNGKQSGRSMSYDGENSDEGHASERHFSEEVQTGYSEENVEEVEVLSEDDLVADVYSGVKEEKSENNGFMKDQDPLVESILSLQSVQEALEKEVKKLEEIGKEPLPSPNNWVDGSSVPGPADSSDPEIHEPNSSEQLGSENIRPSAVSSLEMQILSLKQNIQSLESKLEESRAMLEVKSFRIAELEATINSSKSPKEESGSTTDLLEKKSREIEYELEGLFKQRIEAEVEYLAITRTIQSLKIAASNQITLFEEQESLANEQAQMINKLGETENKAAKLKKQAEELEKYCGDILGTEEVLIMQRRVCKVSSCFFIQFLLLVVAFWVFWLQLSPYTGAVVPT